MKNEGGRVKREAGRAGGTAGRVGNYEVTNVVPSPSRGGLERGWGPLASRLIHRLPLLCTPSPSPHLSRAKRKRLPLHVASQRAAQLCLLAATERAVRSASGRRPIDIECGRAGGWRVLARTPCSRARGDNHPSRVGGAGRRDALGALHQTAVRVRRDWVSRGSAGRPMRRAVISDALIARIGTGGRSRAIRRAVAPELV